MQPVGLANTRMSTACVQKSPHHRAFPSQDSLLLTSEPVSGSRFTETLRSANRARVVAAWHIRTVHLPRPIQGSQWSSLVLGQSSGDF